MSKPEERFQNRIKKEMDRLGIESIPLYDLMNPAGRPDLLLLGPVKYLYMELKADDHKKDFMLKVLFRPTQLPYYYDFLRTEEWELFVTIKMNRGYQVIKMTRKLVKEILKGLKFSELTTKWYNNENFFTSFYDMIEFFRVRLRDGN